MRTVYRMENKYGRGPYTPNPGFSWEDTVHTSENGHPAPQNDSFSKKVILELYNLHRLKCGFATMEQALNWFSPSEIQRLRSKGFNLKKVLASRVYEGTFQVLFLPLQNLRKVTKTGDYNEYTI